MRANIFFFVILIAIGLAIVLCRDMTRETGAKSEFGPITASTESMKLVFRHR
jgi:hypothetical protein